MMRNTLPPLASNDLFGCAQKAKASLPFDKRFLPCKVRVVRHMHRREVSTNNQRDAGNNHDCATTHSAASASHNNAIQRILKERKNEHGPGSVEKRWISGESIRKYHSGNTGTLGTTKCR